MKWTSPLVLLGLVLAVALVLALTSMLPGIHTGGDNAAYVALANSLAGSGSYAEAWHPGAPPHTKYPPAYPAALALLMLLGARTWGTLQIASLGFAAVATAFCFLWVQRLRGAPVAAAVAFLFGIAPGVLYASQWILSEPMFLACTIGCLWLLTPHSVSADKSAAPTRLSTRELSLGLALAIAAYFTRSAGLPLVLAVAAWLMLARRWTAVLLFGAAFAVLLAPWQLRSGAQYVSEFWMLNPYAPDLGTAGIGDLVQRVVQNLGEYTFQHVPTGLSGLDGTLAAALGTVLALCTIVGWLRRTVANPGVAELFFPLYAGLILLWPVQWSADRFALPLFPLVLLYAGETASWVLRRVSRRSPWIVAGAAAVVIALPALNSWRESAAGANNCRISAATPGPFGCYGSNVREFQAMALWTRSGLPEGSVVFSRKPRLFYAFSGHASVTYPFTDDGYTLLTQADSLGVGYVVVGNWDFSGPAYVNPVITANPERFCVVAQLNGDTGSPITLLAITDPEPEDAGGEEVADDPPGEAGVGTCLAEDWATPPPAAALASMTIPILDREQ